MIRHFDWNRTLNASTATIKSKICRIIHMEYIYTGGTGDFKCIACAVSLNEIIRFSVNSGGINHFFALHI